MATSAKMSSECILSFYFFLLLMRSNLSTAATDTISRGQFITGNQRVVSKGAKFELGFFTPGNSLNYYVGIRYKNIPQQTIIWVANRRVPLSNPSSSQLKLAKDGNLVLFSNLKSPVWSTNSTSSSSSVATLLDTGNLVLRDSTNTSVILWQSFDHPADTFISYGWFGINKITGEYQRLIPWKNSEDPSPGNFVQSIDPDGAEQFVLLYNNSRIYWKSGLWNGQTFDLIPEMRNNHSLFIQKFVDNDQRRCLTYHLADSNVLSRTMMAPSGQLQTWMWFNSADGWELVWAEPASQCDIYSVCGAFGVCDLSGMSVCSCPLGFEQANLITWELGEWSSGCKRHTQLQCGGNSTSSGRKDEFFVMSNMRLPTDYESLTVSNIEECEAACLNNCSCTAYSYHAGCIILKGDIRNLQRVPSGGNGVGTLYLRLAAADMPKKRRKKKLIVEVIVVVLVVTISLLAIATFILMTYRKYSGKKEFLDVPLVSFTYSELRRVTRNFSDKLGGGGFGPVYKGSLSDSTIVAVKRLEGARQGEKQFRNELRTLGKLQHINLVCLQGFCCEGSERILVYEYMPNRSLDHFLFQEGTRILDWKMRFQIILGTARGLAYLHEGCRECIIHCDIKPENVLLDSEFCPKVADFGMAKLIGHDISRVLTTMRGTVGYLAPEWISGVPITTKVDVYSFGMMIFEVVSGRRNVKVGEDGATISFFPIRAATGVLRNEVISLLDEDLDGRTDIVELDRVCRVACWCIQDSEEDRPSMGEVVKILEGVLDVGIPPLPISLQHILGKEEIRRASQ